MAGEEPRFPDPDDWWATPSGQSQSRQQSRQRSRERQPYPEPEIDEAGPGAYRVNLPIELTPRMRLYGAIGLGAVVVLLIGLAVGGVFSSSSKKTPPITTVHHQTTPPGTTAATTTTKAPAASAPTSTLKPGDSGAQVKLLQRALATLGYSPGAVDGSYGPKTITAVKDFQQAEGLTVDGVFGPKTLSTLRKKLVG